MREDDTEYNRKVPLLITLAYFAIVMLTVFSIIAFSRSNFLLALKDIIVLGFIIAGFLHVRITGNLNFAIYMYICLLGVLFITDFTANPFMAMWSYTLPLLCFFLVGTRSALALTSLFFLMECFYMYAIAPHHYPDDFKLRFPAIFICIALIAFFFEWVRTYTQDKLEHSRSMLKIQRDIGIVLGSEEHLVPALNRMLDIVLKIKEIDCGRVYLVDKKTGALDLVIHRGITPEVIQEVSYFGPDSPNARLVMKGTPVFHRYEEMVTFPISDAQKREDLKAMAVLPIQNEGKTVAMLNLASHVHENIPPETQNLLESISSNLGNAIARMIAIEELRALSLRNDAILSAVPDIIMEVDNNKVYTWANKAGLEFFGNDVVGKDAGYYFEGAQETFNTVEPVFAGSENLVYVESLQRRKDGEKRLLAWWCRSLKDGEGSVTGALSSARDITDYQKLEQQLRQAQKMDAIGQLAGGIAHDFNNQLTAISGFAELVSQNAGENELLSRSAANILLTAKRSSDLTAQLLAFSRKGKILSVATDVHKIIVEVIEILSHTIDKRIFIKQRLNAIPSAIQCDPSQIQNALLNLAINARDAMPHGGELIFQTEGVYLDSNYSKIKHYKIPQGDYVLISITDDGTGMDAETQKHIFEPFFTTKAQGKGTGMGLAAVYGIVKNHKGAVNVYSEPGHGTTVKLYFPASFKGIVAEDLPAMKIKAPERKLNILFVDDEEMICEMAGEMLASFGYKVVVFGSGKKAVEYYKKSWQSIDLVIMDMIMPEMDGKETFMAMRAVNPAIRTVLSSGYSINGEAQGIINEGVRGFIQKPFMFDQMVKAIEDAMV
jgi:PAS domain S-box-containing protein